MRNHTHIYLFMVLFTALSLLGGCRDGKDPKPCAGKQMFKADFRIEEQMNGGEKVETDTVLVYNAIHFTAADKYDSYRWRVGNDPRVFDRQSFFLSFDEAVGKVDITLVATKTPDPCLPEDDGVDSLTKSIYVLERTSPFAPILGHYQGYNLDSPKDTFTVKIERYMREVAYDTYRPSYRLVNLNKGCYYEGLLSAIAGRAVEFDGGGFMGNNCLNPAGTAVLDKKDRNIIRINYSLREGLFPNRANKVFVGKRIK